MSLRAVVFSCIVSTFGVLLFLKNLPHSVESDPFSKKVMAFWKKEMARQVLQKNLALGQLADFKQEVATRIFQTKGLKSKKRWHDLATGIPHKGSHALFLGPNAQGLLKNAKDFINKKEYEKSSLFLHRLIHQFPDSHFIVETYFLLVHIHLSQGQEKEAISWVQKMLDLFPESTFTGEALLKIGRVYETQGRLQEAKSLYKTIVASYGDLSLKSKAQKAIKSLAKTNMSKESLK